EPAGAVVGRGAGLAGAGGQPGQQLGVHGHDGPGLGPESLVGVAAAGGAGALARAAPDPEALGAGVGVQDLCERLCAPAVPDRAAGAAVGVWAVGLERAPADLLPPGRTAAVLRPPTPKSESGCSDPPWLPTRLRRKEKAV